MLTSQSIRGLLEAAPDAIIAVDTDGRIVLANAQVEDLFGYARDELVGQPVEVLIPERFRGPHGAFRSGYFADPTPRPMGAGVQLLGRRHDGTEFPADISLNAVDTGEGRIVAAAIRDVTERVEAEAERERLRLAAERERFESQLRQVHRLESLGQLAGGVAHDFNNLLAVILNYAAFVSDEVKTISGDEDTASWARLRRDVEQIERAARRGVELTHQLLAFGRREVIRPQVLDVNGVVAAVEQLLRRTLGEHVDLKTSAQPDLWPVLMDPGQLEQVLVNLAVNARDAMPRGGRLTVDTENIEVDDAYAARVPDLTPGPYVRMRVSDTGSGMAPDVVDRAFEPFFTTKPKGAGTGLGLATVYGIVTQAGGSAHIHSEVGLGTTFTALLPRSTEVVPAAAPAPPVEIGQSHGETVLLVEDEEAMREVTRRILSRSGYQVLVAATGAAAIAYAASPDEDITLLLTDVIMPEMLGKEVAERVAAIRPGIRILYMSGYAQPVLASGGTLAEGVELLEKPFTESVLLRKVREVIDARP